MPALIPYPAKFPTKMKSDKGTFECSLSRASFATWRHDVRDHDVAEQEKLYPSPAGFVRLTDEGREGDRIVPFCDYSALNRPLISGIVRALRRLASPRGNSSSRELDDRFK